MTSARFSTRHIAGLAGSFFGHAAALVVGFVFMVVGLALGVTMIMLPVGIVIGMAGVLLFIGGLFAHIGPDP